jgi:uncharacterized protein DUF6869
MDYWTLHSQVATDPERAWPSFVRFIRDPAPGDPERILQVLDLLEDFVYDHAAAFIDRIEALAESDPTFKELVADAFVGGVGGEAVERFHALQERLFAELGRESPY